MTGTIGLVGCGKIKLPHEAPAWELYQGALFKKAARYCQDNYNQWFILSSLHGLVSPETILKPYDVTLNNVSKKEREKWAMKVLEQIKSLGLHGGQFYFHAGKKYTEELWKLLFYPVAPLARLGIGQQLKWYKTRGY